MCPPRAPLALLLGETERQVRLGQALDKLRNVGPETPTVDASRFERGLAWRPRLGG